MSNEKRFVKKKQLDFDIITNHIQQIYNKKDFNIKNFSFHINDAINQLNVHFIRKNVGKEEIFTKTYVPRTWKDHFKKKYRTKWWMRWWIKRRPIQHLQIKRITIFPEVEIPNLPEFKQKITYVEAYPKFELP